KGTVARGVIVADDSGSDWTWRGEEFVSRASPYRSKTRRIAERPFKQESHVLQTRFIHDTAAHRVRYGELVENDVIGTCENVSLNNIQSHRAEGRGSLRQKPVPVPCAEHDTGAVRHGALAPTHERSRG